MKISHKSCPCKGFPHFVPGAVEAVVLFGAAFEGTRFHAAGPVGHEVAGDPLQQEFVQGLGPRGPVVEPQIRRQGVEAAHGSRKTQPVKRTAEELGTLPNGMKITRKSL